VLDVLFPALCIACRAAGCAIRVALCATCLETTSPSLEGPMCRVVVRASVRDRPPGRVRAAGACHDSAAGVSIKPGPAMRYDEASKASISGAEACRPARSGTPACRAGLARTGRPLLDEADLIVPVPLHPMRLWSRRLQPVRGTGGRPAGAAFRENLPTRSS